MEATRKLEGKIAVDNVQWKEIKRESAREKEKTRRGTCACSSHVDFNGVDETGHAKEVNRSRHCRGE